MGFFDSLFGNSAKATVNEDCSSSTENNFSNFTPIAQYIYERSGITDLDKRGIISNKLKEFAKEEKISTTDVFLNQMQSNEEFYQKVMNIVTVNETYFFREIRELEWLVTYAKELNTPLKILSMPCASGEEVYSILLMLREADVDISKIEIVGYDINSDAVEEAKEGLYSERSLHKIDADIKQKYFTQEAENRYAISPSLKCHAVFYQKNIFEITEEEKFDIVLSRNMFIYFDNKKRKQATAIIIRLLKKRGIYIKGHADHIKPNQNLQNITFGIYQKV